MPYRFPLAEPALKGQLVPIAESFAARGISLPSSGRLALDDITFIAETVITLIHRCRAGGLL